MNAEPCGSVSNARIDGAQEGKIRALHRLPPSPPDRWTTSEGIVLASQTGDLIAAYHLLSRETAMLRTQHISLRIEDAPLRIQTSLLSSQHVALRL